MVPMRYETNTPYCGIARECCVSSFASTIIVKPNLVGESCATACGVGWMFSSLGQRWSSGLNLSPVFISTNTSVVHNLSNVTLGLHPVALRVLDDSHLYTAASALFALRLSLYQAVSTYLHFAGRRVVGLTTINIRCQRMIEKSYMVSSRAWFLGDHVCAGIYLRLFIGLWCDDSRVKPKKEVNTRVRDDGTSVGFRRDRRTPATIPLG